MSLRLWRSRDWGPSGPRSSDLTVGFQARVYVAGGGTLIGAALVRQLKASGYRNLVGLPGAEPDLTDAVQVDAFFASARPDYVFVAAGRSGGIEVNSRRPAELMRDNLLVTSHVLEAARRYGTKKLLYLGSSCAYPKHCPQPMRVEALLTGPLEPTSAAYAVAKIAGMTLCDAYRRQYGCGFVSAIPADVFGPGDDFSPENSHVVAALVRRMHEAKVQGQPTVSIWGTGRPRRELMFCDDLADACLFVMREYDGGGPINLGVGEDVSIAELAAMIREIVGYDGRLVFDTTRPDGMPRKLLDSSELAGLGWRAKTSVREGLAATYRWFLEQEGDRHA
jgi:GDP-L-fucose synthase